MQLTMNRNLSFQVPETMQKHNENILKQCFPAILVQGPPIVKDKGTPIYFCCFYNIFFFFLQKLGSEIY